MQKFSIGTIGLPGAGSLFFIAGPCVIESRDMAFAVAGELQRISLAEGVPFIFKGSYRKANRSSATSFTGIGDEEALGVLAEIRERFGMPVLTDVHEVAEVERAAPFVDVLQIPAFLSRQTELLAAAGRSGRAVNIKKGQFMAPGDMALAAAKVAGTGNSRIMLTERGSSFGYHNLVVDFRGIPQMAETGYPVVYDATHSLQLPGAGNGVSGGERQFLLPLARAAVAAGVNGLFFEVHPDPASALSDAATQIALGDFAGVVNELQQLSRCVQSIHSR
ncbi:MAG: 3-deoxy-8-phosphooctulonate synthase [Chlorobium sp.]|uniref:3-deoxy-8-phosphooctulonate synthase n=1 Tax=Chlorobium sp. TaxID=1095 RepID=UPI001DBEE462|nr:3-deoxy-8-phosphooctulonate synthase [Chlorobium sp.]MBN1278534.1 3-deoxy-8-phosphooctulonate synthase [Chlorobiaceae bacterium]MCF8215560.1 3-deoxy-8-phosphooctulonate synthase [Chlorobium sp.]MCF8270386.1 3-deoxy-8-phosphooctulonate synthase [Chlorobium sp.]MCF8286755.1 3-deoxy-8-phosphooctulonate synthase [Chlorobium sp.]MCF8290277.1 3-deoxy-8-phosphooctulonate synthase [Chlorobium sp.]